MNDDQTNWLVRYWNRCKPYRAAKDYRLRINEFRFDVHHAVAQKIFDRNPRGISRNRYGANNRRWRRYQATQPRVIFSTPFFDITE